jgi:hypothetical protein
MKVEEIKNIAEREPFRPFAIRLSNGAQYQFSNPRDFGAAHDYSTIVSFGETPSTRIVLIDPESITAIMQP